MRAPGASHAAQPRRHAAARRSTRSGAHLPLQVLEEAGAPAPRTFYLHVRLNGAFFGLFSFVEMIDKTFLKVCAHAQRALTCQHAPADPCLQPQEPHAGR